MKRIYLYLSCVLAALGCCFISSCSKAPEVKLSSTEGWQQIQKILEEKVGKDVSFILLEAGSDKKSDELQSLTLVGASKTCIYTPMMNQFTSTDSDEKLKGKPEMKVSDINIPYILKGKAEVEKAVQEKTSDFLTFYVSKVSITVNDDGKIQYQIDIIGQKKDNAPCYYGQRVSPQSDLFLFPVTINDKGEITQMEIEH